MVNQVDRNKKLTQSGLIYTLHVCKRSLPSDAHPVHRQRLERLERLLKNLK